MIFAVSAGNIRHFFRASSDPINYGWLPTSQLQISQHRLTYHTYFLSHLIFLYHSSLHCSFQNSCSIGFYCESKLWHGSQFYWWLGNESPRCSHTGCWPHIWENIGVVYVTRYFCNNISILVCWGNFDQFLHDWWNNCLFIQSRHHTTVVLWPKETHLYQIGI